MRTFGFWQKDTKRVSMAATVSFGFFCEVHFFWILKRLAQQLFFMSHTLKILLKFMIGFQIYILI